MLPSRRSRLAGWMFSSGMPAPSDAVIQPSLMARAIICDASTPGLISRGFMIVSLPLRYRRRRDVPHAGHRPRLRHGQAGGPVTPAEVAVAGPGYGIARDRCRAARLATHES